MSEVTPLYFKKCEFLYSSVFLYFLHFSNCKSNGGSICLNNLRFAQKLVCRQCWWRTRPLLIVFAGRLPVPEIQALEISQIHGIRQCPEDDISGSDVPISTIKVPMYSYERALQKIFYGLKPISEI